MDATQIKTIAAAAAAGIAVLYILKRISKSRNDAKLRRAVKEHIEKRDASIRRLKEKLDGMHLNDGEVDQITDLPLRELVAELQSDHLTPTRVLHAFQRKALDAHGRTNCVCEFVQDAEHVAAQLEAQFDGKMGKPPLYGVPISIKESIQMKGYISTRGYAQTISRKESSVHDANIVTHLRTLGAVPFVRTNVPQTLLSFNCANPVYGTTSHPQANHRTSGGSSGGEASLVAQRGAPIGIGGDVGGSIRIPAHYSGVCGLKPGSRRMTQHGSVGSIPGRPCVESSIGPLARSVDDLKFFMSAVLNGDLFRLDPLVAPIPLRSEVLEGDRPLRVGMYVHNGIIEAAPSCIAAVAKARAALESRGHEVIEIEPYGHQEGQALFYGACFIDGGDYLLQQLKGDLLEPSYKVMVKLLSVPPPILKLALLVGRYMSPRDAEIQQHLFKDAKQMRKIYERCASHKREVIKHWMDLGVDGVICPANASVAMTHSGPPKAPMGASYTYVYNLLDFPAGVVQTHRVTNDDIAALDAYATRARDRMTRTIADDNRGSIGLPAAAQVVALPHGEEVCLRIMAEIEQGL